MRNSYHRAPVIGVLLVKVRMSAEIGHPRRPAEGPLQTVEDAVLALVLGHGVADAAVASEGVEADLYIYQLHSIIRSFHLHDQLLLVYLYSK